MRKFSLNIFQPILVAIVVGMAWYGISHIEGTISYFNDTESSLGNFFSATKLDFIIKGGDSTDDGGYRTQTQGGWGQVASGNNPGSYRDANFASAFPDGISIGDDSMFSAKFSSAQSIEDFLPAKGGPNIFDENYVDPHRTSAKVFGGQVLALALNIGFDFYDPNFGENDGYLSNWVLDGSDCAGMTAGEVLAEANKKIAGLASNYSAPYLNGCADYINNRWNNGTSKGDSGHTIDALVTKFDEGIDFKYNVSFLQIGGNTAFCDAINISALKDDVEVYNGSLSAFISPNSEYSDQDDVWKFILTPPTSGFSSGDDCQFNIVFDGWQYNLLQFPFGFHDTEIISDVITYTGSLVAPAPVPPPPVPVEEVTQEVVVETPEPVPEAIPEVSE